MNAWESIQSVLDRIEDELGEVMDIASLSGTAGLSPFYFQRLFSRLVGKPAMEYVKLRRLARAAAALEDRGSAVDTRAGSIVDIAFECGFESHEHFTRSFKEAYGVSPSMHRSRPRPLSHFLKPDLSMMYRVVDEGVPLLAEGVLVELRRKALRTERFLGLSTETVFSRGPGVDSLGELWGRFHEAKTEASGLAGRIPEVGVSSPGSGLGRFKYFAGARAPETQAPKECLWETWERPAGDYVVCSVEAEDFHALTTEALDKARDYLFGVWLPAHGLVCDPFMIELYPDTGSQATAMELQVRIATD